MNQAEPPPHLASAAARVTAVIVVWNSGGELITLLGELREAFAAGMRAVVVDNASADGSFERLADFLDQWEHGGQVELVQAGDNIGFSAGVNLAVEHALAASPSPEFIWMLNPDVSLAEETLRELVAVADASGAAIVSGRHASENLSNEAWPSVFWLPPWTWGKRPPWSGRWRKAGRYAGSCALVRTSAIDQLVRETGMFQDETLFMYWDEWDCSLRARWLKLPTVEAALARQRTPSPSRAGEDPLAAVRRYYLARNAVLVARKHVPAWKFWPMLTFRVLHTIQWHGRQRLSGERPRTGLYLSATWDGVRGKTGRWEHHPAGPTASR